MVGDAKKCLFSADTAANQRTPEACSNLALDANGIWIRSTGKTVKRDFKGAFTYYHFFLSQHFACHA